RNAPSDASDRGAESPSTPAAANPRNTMLPVIFAVNTRPNPRKLTASTTPVTNVRINKAGRTRSLFSAIQRLASSQNARQSQPRPHNPASPSTHFGRCSIGFRARLLICSRSSTCNVAAEFLERAQPPYALTGDQLGLTGKSGGPSDANSCV